MWARRVSAEPPGQPIAACCDPAETAPLMTLRERLQLETLLRHLTLVGFAVLAAWSVIGLYGTLGGFLEVNRPATLRFLLVVMLLVYSHHFLVKLRERRLRRLPPDERYGFRQTADTDATGSTQPAG